MTAILGLTRRGAFNIKIKLPAFFCSFNSCRRSSVRVSMSLRNLDKKDVFFLYGNLPWACIETNLINGK